jgi:LacI family transcriptional regulator
LIPDTSNAFYGAIAASVEKALRDEGLTMILCNTNEDPDAQDEYLWEMRAHMVRGIALFGAVPSPALKDFVADGHPIVFVNRKPPKGLDGCFVGIDNRRAGMDVARHFLDHGYTPCGVIHGPLSSSASAERYRGFLSALRAAVAGIGAAACFAGDLTLEAGHRGAAALLDHNPDLRAIFCGNDLMAYGAYRLCHEIGRRVPQDVALFGFDDNPLNQWVAPWLSTVRVPYEAFGPAVRRLFDQLWAEEAQGKPSQIILPHELVLRASA